MLKTKKLLIVFGIILVGFIWLVFKNRGGSQSETAVVPAPTVQESAFEGQTASFGVVTVEVTPVKLETNQEAIFAVKFNTHSVNLDLDFSKIMVLSDDLGNRYQAKTWTGGRGGHHLTGEIIFPGLKTGAKNIALTVSQIEGETKTFTFKIK